jgi:hypothetical protein
MMMSCGNSTKSWMRKAHREGEERIFSSNVLSLSRRKFISVGQQHSTKILYAWSTKRENKWYAENKKEETIFCFIRSFNTR